MTIAFTPIVAFHAPARRSQRDAAGRKSITAPRDQTAPRRKHTVGG
jgi:hypothetical protein